MIRYTVTILKFNYLFLRIYPGRTDTKKCLDVVLGIVVGGFNQGVFKRLRALEIFLNVSSG